MWTYLFRRRKRNILVSKRDVPIAPSPRGQTPSQPPLPAAPRSKGPVKRHFYNGGRFQCYASFFPHWGGWMTAGHCMTETQDHIPPFAIGDMIKWPDGLDAALIGCRLPAQPPRAPREGEAVLAEGYPAGSRHLEQRRGKVYFQRAPGVWIMHIDTPDEPVVTGMSGGRVRSLETGETLGILITRNSPADLDRDQDPDESCDFTALSAVWDALSQELMA